MADREHQMEDEGFVVSLHHYTPLPLREGVENYDFCKETEYFPMFHGYNRVVDKFRNAVTEEVEKRRGLEGAYEVTLLGYEVTEYRYPSRWAFGRVTWSEKREREWELERTADLYEGLERTDERYMEILDSILDRVQIQCTEWNQKGVTVTYR